MDVTTARQRTDEIVTRLVAGLTPDDKERSTPCAKWTVHDLVNHMCGGAHMIAGALEGSGEAPAPGGEMPDLLAEGPVKGWRDASDHLAAASTPEALAATTQMPFGEVPGAMGLSVIVADHVIHAWDLAAATGQDHGIDDDLARFAYDTFEPLVPDEARDGDAFAAIVAVAEDAPLVDRMIGFSGRDPNRSA